MTAVFFFKDESSMKARQTVFSAYKKPRGQFQFREREEERETVWCDATQFGEKMWQKITLQ